MPNQHSGNFEKLVKDKFQCSAREMLLKCKADRLTYREVGELLGLKHGAVRKWANRLKVRLPTEYETRKYNISINYSNQCKLQKLTIRNMLSSSWINKNLYSKIKGV